MSQGQAPAMPPDCGKCIAGIDCDENMLCTSEADRAAKPSWRSMIGPDHPADEIAAVLAKTEERVETLRGWLARARSLVEPEE